MIEALLAMRRTSLENECTIHHAQAQELTNKWAKLVSRERELIVEKQRYQTADGEAKQSALVIIDLLNCIAKLQQQMEGHKQDVNTLNTENEQLQDELEKTTDLMEEMMLEVIDLK